MSMSKKTESKIDSCDEEQNALRLILDVLEVCESDLSDWYNLDKSDASNSFDVVLSKLDEMADAGIIPIPAIIVDDFGFRAIRFNDNCLDKFLDEKRDLIVD